MLNKERAQADSPIKCTGCLADKVGYGKTVVSLALIDADKDRTIAAHPQLFTTSGTLIVAPTHVVAQWEAEARKFLGTSAQVIVLKTIVPLKRSAVAEHPAGRYRCIDVCADGDGCKALFAAFQGTDGSDSARGQYRGCGERHCGGESSDHVDIEFPFTEPVSLEAPHRG